MNENVADVLLLGFAGEEVIDVSGEFLSGGAACAEPVNANPKKDTPIINRDMDLGKTELKIFIDSHRKALLQPGSSNSGNYLNLSTGLFAYCNLLANR